MQSICMYMCVGWLTAEYADLTYEKGTKLIEAGCAFSDFGTRRRRSYRAQDLVVSQLARAAKDRPGKGKVLGTSNVGSNSGFLNFCQSPLISPHTGAPCTKARPQAFWHHRTVGAPLLKKLPL
jgi:hypothetical protein